MLGKLLADSGGADQVIDTLLTRHRGNLVPWAMTLVALIIGLPMFFEIGLVLLIPVIVLVAQRAELPLMRVAIPALAGLSVLHGLIPPHPGPLVAIAALHASLGTTLALGLVVAIPTVVICGPLLIIVVTRLVPVEAPERAGGVDASKPQSRSEDVEPTAVLRPDAGDPAAPGRRSCSPRRSPTSSGTTTTTRPRRARSSTSSASPWWP